MHPRILATLRALVVVAVPLLLVGNMLWVLAQPWLVTALYALPGIPAPMAGSTATEQAALATTGVRAIQPAGAGIEPLRDARLPDGALAFTPREVTHMEDVRAVVDAFVIGWGVAAVVVVVGLLAARGFGGREAVLRALGRGAWLTLAVIGVAGLGMLVSFDAFFVAFHGVFFEGSSWRFEADATLLELYPERFWVLSGGLAAALILGQALALALLSRRRIGARPNPASAASRAGGEARTGRRSRPSG